MGWRWHACERGMVLLLWSSCCWRCLSTMFRVAVPLKPSFPMFLQPWLSPVEHQLG